MPSLSAIAVYCGSSLGTNPAYADAARALGTELGERGIAVVYGGATVGLMGVVANRCLEAGGTVIGVITEHLRDRELAHTEITELVVVETMHERKAVMADRSDAVIMLPGGFGTLEEFTEAVTWSQLGLDDKACGLLNIDGFFDAFTAFLDHATHDGFIKAAHRAMVLEATTPSALLDAIESAEPISIPKWVDPIDRR